MTDPDSTQTRKPLDVIDGPNDKENPMTVTDRPAATTTTNPHRAAVFIFGWAVPIVFLGAMWGAGHNPQNASWSAAAVIAVIVLYAIYKIRSVAWARRYGAGK